MLGKLLNAYIHFQLIFVFANKRKYFDIDFNQWIIGTVLLSTFEVNCIWRNQRTDAGHFRGELGLERSKHRCRALSG